MPRGSIFDVRGNVLASSQVIDGISRRTYTDPAFTHLIGFASLRFGTTGLERAWDDILHRPDRSESAQRHAWTTCWDASRGRGT